MLPFYILHQTVMVAVSYYVVQWHLADGLKLLLIALSAFAITLAIYHFLIRPFNPIRWLFGLRPLKR
jgi:glucans biosynthesis protein C